MRKRLLQYYIPIIGLFILFKDPDSKGADVHWLTPVAIAYHALLIVLIDFIIVYFLK